MKILIFSCTTTILNTIVLFNTRDSEVVKIIAFMGIVMGAIGIALGLTVFP